MEVLKENGQQPPLFIETVAFMKRSISNKSQKTGGDGVSQIFGGNDFRDSFE